MTTSHQHLSDADPGAVTIDVQVNRETSQPQSSARPVAQADSSTTYVEGDYHAPEPGETSSALATTGGSFGGFLAPLNREEFKSVVEGVEQKLQVVNQTLSMLLETDGFDQVLEDMLQSITLKTGELLSADRTTIYLKDDEKNELYTIVAQGKGEKSVEIRIPADKGIAGESATFKRVINIPYDFYDDPRSAFAQIQDKRNGYRTYTMLTLPLLNEAGDLVAVVQLLNKLKPDSGPSTPLADKIDMRGFTEADQQLFKEFAPSIRLILESSRRFYVATQKQRAVNALIDATQSLSKSSLDLDETLKQVMAKAKQLMNADRSTLWLIDADRNEIWTKIETEDGSLKEIRIPVGVGFAGQVAASGEMLNIGFDLYDHPGAEKSKELDQQNGYRTCSLLCMPIRNADGELIGVTQLLNKVKQGLKSEYDPSTWPEAPECWKASFNRTDQEFMDTFNIQAGVALQNAKLFATVKQQEQLQRDILRSLTNGVISTDKQGKIIAANESAKDLIGLPNNESIEGLSIKDLVRIERGDFGKWFELALQAKDEKSRKQYYPDQTMQSVQGDAQHSINLSINTILDVANAQQPTPSGVLVVMDDISDEKRLKSTMYRYMTQELAEQLLENPDAARMGGDRKKVSVLFSDIRSYTTITESLTAEEVVDMLNSYFERMVDSVFQHKGTLDKYIGDAIMAVFGSPVQLADHEWLAVQTALDMRHRLVEFNAEWTAGPATLSGPRQPIRIGIGINSDEVISGNIGSSKRMEFTAIGDGVNLGSRLEGASKQYGTDIVVSHSTYEPCADRVWARELDYIKVKGKTKPVAVYELVGLKSDPLLPQQEAVIEHYHKGREYYINRQFAMAMGEFGRVLEINKNDKSSKLHLDRCQHWLQNPPPDDWDGSWTFSEK